VLNGIYISLHSETIYRKVLLQVYYREEEILHGSEGGHYRDSLIGTVPIFKNRSKTVLL
jgi:hypothetical protein